MGNKTTAYNYLESSATALFAAGFMKAIRLGYIQGVRNINADTKDGYDNITVNLAGQRTSKAYRGIAISKGKKISR